MSCWTDDIWNCNILLHILWLNFVGENRHKRDSITRKCRRSYQYDIFLNWSNRQTTTKQTNKKGIYIEKWWKTNNKTLSKTLTMQFLIEISTRCYRQRSNKFFEFDRSILLNSNDRPISSNRTDTISNDRCERKLNEQYKWMLFWIHDWNVLLFATGTYLRKCAKKNIYLHCFRRIPEIPMTQICLDLLVGRIVCKF